MAPLIGTESSVSRSRRALSTHRATLDIQLQDERCRRMGLGDAWPSEAVLIVSRVSVRRIWHTAALWLESTACACPQVRTLPRALLDVLASSFCLCSGPAKEHAQATTKPDATPMGYPSLAGHSFRHSPQLIGNQDGLLVGTKPGNPHRRLLHRQVRC